MFIIGDSSGPGFGSVFWVQGEKTVNAEVGRWKKEVAEGESSNFREACNLVNRTIRLAKEGKIKTGSEVFVVTDNVVTESIFYKGSSKTSSLNELIVELRKLECENCLIIHVIWCSGKRMIRTGVDGISRGDFASGVMNGISPLRYLPFNETAIERHPKLMEEVLEWTKRAGDFEHTAPVD